MWNPGNNVIYRNKNGFVPCNYPPREKICPHFKTIEKLAKEFFGFEKGILCEAQSFCGRYNDGSYANDGSGSYVQETICLRLYHAIEEAIYLAEKALEAKIDQEGNVILTYKASELISKDEFNDSDLVIKSGRIKWGKFILDNFKKANPSCIDKQIIQTMQDRLSEYKELLLDEIQRAYCHDMIVPIEKCPNAPSWGGCR